MRTPHLIWGVWEVTNSCRKASKSIYSPVSDRNGTFFCQFLYKLTVKILIFKALAGFHTLA